MTDDDIRAIVRERVRAYKESYTRYLIAKRDFPQLNHDGHEPACDLLPRDAAVVRSRVERDFYRSL
jgi:hypothetical protein